jgi:hypothetical protein
LPRPARDGQAALVAGGGWYADFTSSDEHVVLFAASGFRTKVVTDRTVPPEDDEDRGLPVLLVRLCSPPDAASRPGVGSADRAGRALGTGETWWRVRS